MTISRNKLYALIMTGCIGGYVWLYYCFQAYPSGNKVIDACVFKSITGVPCPSCGSTRAVIKAAEGHLLDSILINPFGLIISAIMIAAPIWISIDWIRKKKTLYDFYLEIEKFLKNKKIALILGFLVLLNWIWNITKGL